MRVDAHQHFWRLDRGDYGWLTAADHPLICRDFGPDELSPLLCEAGIERTILVQAAPTVAETRYLLDVANQTDFVAGVVGWVELDAVDAVAVIESLSTEPKLLGLRPMLQDLPDDDWILRPSLAPALDAMAAAGLRFDALVKPRHLPALTRFLDHRPNLPVVIDHGAKPDIGGGELAGWSAAIHEIAKSTHACCKLSGLVTEAAPGWTTEMLKPFADVLLDAFGAERLMWGSDWPVVNEAGGYLAWRLAAEELTGGLSEDDRASPFGGTAQSFYGLAA